MLKRYRYRAYPTPSQEQYLARVFGSVRVVYNDFITYRNRQFDSGEKFTPGSAMQVKLITEARHTEERQWLSEVPNVCLQQSIRDADRAYTNFFSSIAGKRKGRRVGVPRFKKRTNEQQARITRPRVRETTHGVGFLKFPKMDKEIRFNLSRPLPSKPTSATVIKEPDGRYYVSFVVDVGEPTPLPETDTVAGIDLGLTDLAIVAQSDGERYKVPNSRHLKRKERKLAKAQKELSRRKKGSKNREKSRIKVAKLHRKVRETRLDNLRKVSLDIVRENQVIAIESLSVEGLRKTWLGKAINDVGWSTFTRLLQERADEYGRTIVKIDRFAPTTKTCSVCGSVGTSKPLHVRVWECDGCHTVLDRDYNASVNIMLAAGLADRINDCGGNVRLRLAVADPVEAVTHRRA